MRYAGANGRLTLRADSGFYTHGVVSVCRKMDVRFSITIRQHKSLHNLIEAIPEDAWTPIPYWMDGAADVAETTCTPFQSEPDAAPVRLIVRRVKPTPGSQLALFATLQLSRLHHRPGRGDARTGGRPSPPREIENAIRDLKHGVGLNHLPSGRFAANAAWLAVQVMAHNIARWTARIGPGRAGGDHQDLGGGSSPWPDGSPARRAASHCICHSAGLGKPSSIVPWPIARPATPCLTAAAATGRHPANRTSPRTRASPVCECLLLCPLPAISP